MLILLPPSEGKQLPSGRSRPVAWDRLSCPELTPVREQVLAALLAVSAAPDAVARLGVPAGAAGEVAANLAVPHLPAREAIAVYRGVLFAALDHPTLSAAARRRAQRTVRIQSALWGPVAPQDKIAPYRLAMGVTLPGLGPLAAVWREALDPVMTGLAGDGLVVDCRSSSYAAAWRPAGAVARRTVAVRVLTETAGQRTVVSHMAKHTRGLVTRWVLEAPRPPRTPGQLAALVAEHLPCELSDTGARGWVLDVLVPSATPTTRP